MSPMFAFTIVAAVCLLGGSLHTVYAEPQPGDTFREYIWTGPWGNATGWQRVTDPDAPHAGAQAFLPNRTNHIDLADFAGAVRAEIYLEQWGGHAGTSNKRVRVNGNDWIEIPVPPAIPGTAGVNTCPEGYQYFTYPSIPVPLEQLRGGDNTFEFTSGPQVCYNFGWGQWGVYGVTFRLYYDSAESHSDVRITSPEPHSTFGDSLLLQIAAAGASIASVDFIGRYRDFDFEGNGTYRQWHYTYRYGDITRHLGSVSEAPWSLVWRTDWVPDQDHPVDIMARIRDADGLYHMTDAVTGLVLERPHRSIKLYEPYEIPGQWQTRVSHARQFNKVLIPHDVGRAEAAQLILATWSGGHADSIGINDRQIVSHVGWTHDYSYDEVPVPVEHLQFGRNDLFTAARTSHHGIEVLWPGIALKVRYDGQADASATLGGPSIYADTLTNGWSLGNVTELRVDLASTTDPFEGSRALGLETGSRSWELNLLRPAPLDVSAYRSIRMMVRLQDITLSNPSALLIYADGRFESLLAEDRPMGGIDLERSGWQLVDIPLTEFDLSQPYIESLRIRGRVAGHVWIDDLRLVPHPTTHVGRAQAALPDINSLQPNHPNPFNSQTMIGFSLAAATNVDLAIYNLAGQRVTTLLRGDRPAGVHSVRWHGRDSQGRALATGIYISRLQTGAQVTTRKLLLLR